MSSVDETKEGIEGTEVASTLEFNAAMADFEERRKGYYAQRAEEAKALTEQVFEIISALGDDAEVSVKYEGGGDSGDFYWDGGADGEGNSSTIEQEDDRETVMRCAMSLVNLYHGGWEINEGGGGTVTFRARSIDIDHYLYIQETEYDSKTIHNPKYEIEGENEVSQIDAVSELDDDGTLGFTVVRAIETPLNVIYEQEMARRVDFNEGMLAGLQSFLQQRNTFFVFQCYTPYFNDGDPCVNTISICQFGPGEGVVGWNDIRGEDEEDEENAEGGERTKAAAVEMTEGDRAVAMALCTWVSDEFSWLSQRLNAHTTNVTLFVRVQDGELVHESSYYDCGY